MNYQENNEVAKYRKKKDNSSKSNKKSDHKHQYCDCVLVQPKYSFGEHDHAYKGQYCCICGKINEHQRLSYINFYDDFFADEDEIIKKYNDLPVFHLKTYADDYIDLLEANNERN